MDNNVSTLLIKNLPKSINDITNLLPTTPKSIKSFGRRRLLLVYENEATAKTVLEKLQELNRVMPKNGRLNITFFRKNEKPAAKIIKVNKTTQTNLHLAGETATPQINKYITKLYACDAKLNFNQPPPPYLRYAYPRITPDILDAISIALMSNTRFYTQVLHLMNRMNLEPPFTAKPAGMRLTSKWPQDVSTQTEMSGEVIENAVSNIQVQIKTIEKEKSTSESELESAEESENFMVKRQTHVPVKRKAANDIEQQYKKKARQLLQATVHQQKMVITQTEVSQYNNEEKKHIALTQSVFEAATSSGKSRTIALKLQPQKPVNKNVEEFVPPADLNLERLTVEQLQQLPIYKNYHTGMPSNKLYIKNLAKDVSENDLKILYARFASAECLEIKVMQQGRMKGQAFVTFHGLSEMDEALAVAKALKETNGFVLRQKPMVVCYGKKS